MSVAYLKFFTLVVNLWATTNLVSCLLNIDLERLPGLPSILNPAGFPTEFYSPTVKSWLNTVPPLADTLRLPSFPDLNLKLTLENLKYASATISLTAPQVKKQNELNAVYDYVIAGGGTAGCVLAARLSENPDVSVLLLEAGGEETEYWVTSVPALSFSVISSDFEWHYVTTPQEHCCQSHKNRQVEWSSGKGLGGCSSHNLLNVVRGNRLDYDNWGINLNNTGWSYDDLLPYMKKLEGMRIERLQNQSNRHGYTGPVQVNENAWTALGTSHREALMKAGYTFRDDTNGFDQEGFSKVELSFDKDGLRSGATRAYLRPAMGRSNLHVIVHAHVTKILFDQPSGAAPRAIGLEYLVDGQKYTTRAAKEVIVSGGAMNSPQILMLSGIGPKEHLESFNIPVLLDNPAVGNNFYTHIFSFLSFKGNKYAEAPLHKVQRPVGLALGLTEYVLNGTGPLTNIPTEIMGFVKTGLYNTPWPDMQIYFVNAFGLLNISGSLLDPMVRNVSSDDRLFTYLSIHQHPNDTGNVRLQSADPLNHVLIDPKWFKDERDSEAMAKGFQIWTNLLASDPEFVKYNIRSAEYLARDCQQYDVSSYDYFKCMVKSRPLYYGHAAGTCRMGRKGDNSVVDQELKVHGIDGLRVVDASVFPHQITGNTHVTVLTIAEKAADLIKNFA